MVRPTPKGVSTEESHGAGLELRTDATSGPEVFRDSGFTRPSANASPEIVLDDSGDAALL